MFHRHDWKPVAVDYYDRGYLFTRGPMAGKETVVGKLTRVLLRCECGDVKSKDIDGHWTIKQLKGEM